MSIDYARSRSRFGLLFTTFPSGEISRLRNFPATHPSDFSAPRRLVRRRLRVSGPPRTLLRLPTGVHLFALQITLGTFLAIQSRKRTPKGRGTKAKKHSVGSVGFSTAAVRGPLLRRSGEAAAASPNNYIFSVEKGDNLTNAPGRSRN